MNIMNKPLIQTVNLTKHFDTPTGTLHAVDKINISINKGDTLGVVGESGCGKSTLGRTILRLLEPTSGEILYNGVNIAKYNKRQMHEMRKKMQIIFQDPFTSLNPRMTVSQLIADPMIVNRMYKSDKERQQRVGLLMETVGLAPRFNNTYPHEMDGGRRQRVGIARALAIKPEFIVCDEPVSALDVSIQAQILNLMMDLQDRMGLTYMFVTHDLSVIKHISHRVAVMYLGQCVETCLTDELFENPLHPYTQALLAAIPIPSIRDRGELKTLKGEVTSPINPKPGCRFADRCPMAIEECRMRNFELKDVNGSEHFVACRLYE